LKILVTGGKGQLGRAFSALAKDKLYQGCQFWLYDLEEMDILNAPQVMAAVAGLKADVVVHAAAYTQVDKAETDADAAFRLNVTGTQNVAVACLENNAKMVYVSTDYVFDGQKKRPYTEFDATNPLSVYGRTKLLGENIAARINPRLFIARTAWLYGDGANFVQTMLRLAQERDVLSVVNDQTGTPTFTHDLARGIMELVSTSRYGTYHLTNNGSCTWYEFAREIFALRGVKTTLRPITTAEYPTAALRPPCAVLENYMLQMTIGDKFRDWRLALAEYLSANPARN
jgi:dTDP-4-dehydrorhamnose reductase